MGPHTRLIQIFKSKPFFVFLNVAFVMGKHILPLHLTFKFIILAEMLFTKKKKKKKEYEENEGNHVLCVKAFALGRKLSSSTGWAKYANG